MSAFSTKPMIYTHLLHTSFLLFFFFLIFFLFYFFVIALFLSLRRPLLPFSVLDALLCLPGIFLLLTLFYHILGFTFYLLLSSRSIISFCFSMFLSLCVLCSLFDSPLSFIRLYLSAVVYLSTL